MDFDWSMWPTMGCYGSEFDSGLMLDAAYGVSTTPPTTPSDLKGLHSIYDPCMESSCPPYTSDAQGMSTKELLVEWLDGFACPSELPLSPESTPPSDESAVADISGGEWRHCTKLDASRSLEDNWQSTGEDSIICRIPSPCSDLAADHDASRRGDGNTTNRAKVLTTTPVAVSDGPGSSDDGCIPSTPSTRATDTHSDSIRKPLKHQNSSRASHNLVERKYRNGLNEKFTELIAALDIAKTPGEYLGASAERKVLSKGTVLKMAKQKLLAIQAHNRSLDKEVQRLRRLLYARQAATAI